MVEEIIDSQTINKHITTVSAYDLITITGPTASGKTKLAVAVAAAIGSEIISADSRQVYKGMDIGTGKDLSEYTIKHQNIPYHLIDICEAGEKYNVYEFQHDFHRAYNDIKSRNRMPILCGGTGMYIEAVLRGFRLLTVPENPELRLALQNKSIDELKDILASMQNMHNTTDLDSAKRAIRAIEIAEFTNLHPADFTEFSPLNSLIVLVDINRELRREKITQRLKARLNEGMIQEIQNLLDKGIKAEDLIYYGLEYKFVTLYLTHQLSYSEMFQQLEIAIHQFAKRQMTWFRGMERRGFQLHTINAETALTEQVETIKELLKIS